MKFTLKKNVAFQILGLIGLATPFINLDAVHAVLPPEYKLPFQLVVGALMGVVSVIAQHKNPDGASASEPWVKPTK